MEDYYSELILIIPIIHMAEIIVLHIQDQLLQVVPMEELQEIGKHPLNQIMIVNLVLDTMVIVMKGM